MSTETQGVAGRLNTLREYIRTHRWQFAKTMPQIPHWYTVREWDDIPEFDLLVQTIREWGYERRFGRRTYTYLDIDGYTYWTMGAPVAETTVINRKPAEPAYHSALKGMPVMDRVPPVDYVEHRGNIALQWDVSRGTLPAETDPCDVFYADIPWRAGAPVFDERAGVMGTREYSILAHFLDRFVRSTFRPIILCAGRQEPVPAPDEAVATTLHGQPAVLYIYHARLAHLLESTEDVLGTLAAHYDCVGDPFCGYGTTGRVFAAHGKHFVLSDHNPQCIGYIALQMHGWSEGAGYAH